jgi:hypothetical protein
LGTSSALASHCLKAGWLERLGRGVCMFPNDDLQRDSCLKFLAARVPSLHPGSKTALAWRGVRRNLPPREQKVPPAGQDRVWLLRRVNDRG